MKKVLKNMVYILSMIVCSSLLVLSFVPSEASAEGKGKPKDEYSVLIKEAVKAFNAENCSLAFEKFKAADVLKHSSALDYNMGRALECDGKFSEAVDYYTRFVASKDIDHESRMDALERINALKQVISLTGSGQAVENMPEPAPAPKGKKGSGGGKGAAVQIPPGGCVDINTATVAELRGIKGVGESKANTIIENRPYGKVEDLLKVKGIKEKTLDGWRPYICPIGGGQPAAAPAAAPAPKSQPAAPAKAGAAGSAAPAKPLLQTDGGDFNL